MTYNREHFEEAEKSVAEVLEDVDASEREKSLAIAVQFLLNVLRFNTPH